MYELVEVLQGQGVLVDGRRFGNPARPERVVHPNQSARTQQLQCALVVAAVIDLVRVDKRKVVTTGSSVCKFAIKGFQRRGQHQPDPPGHPGFLPVAPRHRRPVQIDVTGQQLAIVRQRLRHHQAAVSGEDADLDAAARAGQSDQQRQQLALLGRDLHARLGQGCRFLAQAGQQRRLAESNAVVVFDQSLRQQETFSRHRQTITKFSCGEIQHPARGCSDNMPISKRNLRPCTEPVQNPVENSRDAATPAPHDAGKSRSRTLCNQSEMHQRANHLHQHGRGVRSPNKVRARVRATSAAPMCITGFFPCRRLNRVATH